MDPTSDKEERKREVYTVTCSRSMYTELTFL